MCFRTNRVTIYERREGGSGVIEEILKVLPEVRCGIATCYLSTSFLITQTTNLLLIIVGDRESVDDRERVRVCDWLSCVHPLRRVLRVQQGARQARVTPGARVHPWGVCEPEAE